jgi:hypothetical protein
MFALLHRLFQFPLVIGKQSMNLPVRLGADRVNLRTKRLPRGFGILIEKRLNLVVVILKQRPDPLLLLRSQLKILRKPGKFLVESTEAYGYAEAAHTLRVAVPRRPEPR